MAGKVKLYLGVCPGSGKRKAMLLDGLEKKKNGSNVIIGAMRYDNRPEILSLADNFVNLGAVITPASKPDALAEPTQVNVDAIIEQNPDIVLFDNAAYEDAPDVDSHEQIEQILRADIDIYLAINIYNLQSSQPRLHQIMPELVTHATIPQELLKHVTNVKMVDRTLDEIEEYYKNPDSYIPDYFSDLIEKMCDYRIFKQLRALTLQFAAHGPSFEDGNYSAMSGTSPFHESNLNEAALSSFEKYRHKAKLFFAASDRSVLDVHTALKGFLWVVAVTALCFGGSFLPGASSTLYALIYILPVMLMGLNYGNKAAIFTALLALATYDIVFLIPDPSFSYEEWTLVSVVFLVVALITARLTVKIRRQHLLAKEREKHISILHILNTDYAESTSLQQLCGVIMGRLQKILNAEVYVYLAESKGKKLHDLHPKNNALTAEEKEAAQFSHTKEKICGLGTEHYGGIQILFFPMSTSTKRVGVLGIRFANRKDHRNFGKRQLVLSLADQAAIAIQRLELSASVKNALRMNEREKLRSALLSSVSHDLKTPLTGIIGSCTAILEIKNLTDEKKMHLVSTIHDEAERLHQFINNILDNIRMQTSGRIQKKDNIHLHELVNSARTNVKRNIFSHTIKSNFPDTLPTFKGDFMLLQQVMQNLLDNASKYSPQHSTISLSGAYENKKLIITIMDEGPGIPKDEQEVIFDKFYRLEKKDNKSGTGLGLAICKGIIDGHDGTIVAGQRADGQQGAQFTITLPLE